MQAAYVAMSSQARALFVVALVYSAVLAVLRCLRRRCDTSVLRDRTCNTGEHVTAAWLQLLQGKLSAARCVLLMYHSQARGAHKAVRS